MEKDYHKDALDRIINKYSATPDPISLWGSDALIFRQEETCCAGKKNKCVNCAKCTDLAKETTDHK